MGTPNPITGELLDNQALLDKIAALEDKLNKATADKGNGVSIRVSAKGGVSVYGLGKFPLTLYMSQWDKLFTVIDKIKAFIQTHKSELTTKGE